MNSENEEFHKKKKNKFIRIATVVPSCYFLLIAHLQYLWFLYSWFGIQLFRDSFLWTTPHLSALLAADLVAISLYFGEKSTPNWKPIYIFLFMINLIFFGYMLTWIGNEFLIVAWLEALPYFLILSIIDYTAIFIKKHPHAGRAYIALLVVSFALFILGVFVYQFSAFGLLPGR